jgi:murein hydrolase activator
VWRASLIALALASVAHADDEPHAQRESREPPHAVNPRAPKVDPHALLAAQIHDEAVTIERATATVADKLVAADAVRAKRVLAAARLLHAHLASDATPEERLAMARRTAAAKLLLERDGDERALLVDELGHLKVAAQRTVSEAEQVAAIALPTELGWPARGSVARHFGTLEHERSKATLSRRGLDIEVEDRAPVVAPADGVVRYAGVIRGLDHGVILDHGGYLSVIAKLGEVALPVGAKVAKGDRLGHAARHRVYFEIRTRVGPGGLPVDPEPLLGKH